MELKQALVAFFLKEPITIFELQKPFSPTIEEINIAQYDDEEHAPSDWSTQEIKIDLTVSKENITTYESISTTSKII